MCVTSSHFPLSVRESLLKKIQCRDHEIVLYDVFQSGVTTSMILSGNGQKHNNNIS